MTAGFARVDHDFELQQKQFLDWRAELRGDFAGLRGEFAGLHGDFAGLRAEVAELGERVDALTE